MFLLEEGRHRDFLLINVFILRNVSGVEMNLE
jgi:hypothetical protein